MSTVVRRICLWCQGGSWKLVRECVDNPCPLYPWRQAEDGDDALLRARIAAFCLSCAGSSEGVAECSADTPMGGQPACPAHPYRIPAELLGEDLVGPDPEFEPAPASDVSPPPVQQPVTAVQQVRFLPGLGEVCAQVVSEPCHEIRCETPSPPGRNEEIFPALSLPEALVGLNSERAPEALDI
jgi:hypothetical protein